MAAVATATELLAPLGEVQLASRLDAVRRRVVEGWPVVREEDEAHEDWLRTHWVVTAVDAGDTDLGSALDLIRDWLRDRRADLAARRAPG